jgi:MFS family permease
VRQRRLALVAALGFGTSLLLAAVAPGFLAALAVLTATGCLMVMHNISANTIVQQDAPEHLRGRVMGFYSLVVLGLAPLGSLQVGWLSEHFGVRLAFGVGGAVCCLSALLLTWWLRRSLPSRRALA